MELSSWNFTISLNSNSIPLYSSQKFDLCSKCNHIWNFLIPLSIPLKSSQILSIPLKSLTYVANVIIFGIS